MTLGGKLLLIRDRMGLTQKAFAEMVGVEVSTIHKIEAGIRVGTFGTWCKIKRATGCSLDEIVEGLV